MIDAIAQAVAPLVGNWIERLSLHISRQNDILSDIRHEVRELRKELADARKAEYTNYGGTE